jgi:glyoxylase-like metal-dependent hydrolase (beta-lactamase superfamily II)
MGESAGLPAGVVVGQTGLWRTNRVLVETAAGVVLVDPSWTPAELDALRADVDARTPRHVHVLVTHADEDHVCGLGWFPEATVVAGARTAARIADGTAAAQLREAEATWGHAWREGLRVDVVAAPGPLALGDLDLVAIDAPGHAADGTAWLLPDVGLLCPGDYVCAVTPPLVLGSLAEARATLARLAAVLAAGRATHVVPGHGPALRAADALALARADLAYLDALAAAAAAAGDADDALRQVTGSVTPPREPIADFAAYAPHRTNALAAVREARSAGGV